MKYDANGNIRFETDGRQVTTEKTYDGLNRIKTAKIIVSGIERITSYTYDSSKVESYTYYADGSLHTKTDRNGDTITYIYDCHGRLKSETVGGDTISYDYDEVGNQKKITDSTGTTFREYDELNRVTSKTVPNIGTVEYEYDIIEGVEEGEIAEKTIDPKGNATTKIYDRSGRLKVVIDGDITSTARTTYEYYDNGSRKSVTYPAGIKEEYTYYPDNTLWTLTNKDVNGTVLDVYTYTYDHANNQTSKHEIINGVGKGTTGYEYDELNRLEKVTEPDGRATSYTYDKAGNRETETITENGQVTEKIYYYNEQNRKMPDLINIRLTKDSPAVEAMDEAASKLGMSRNEMILKAIGMMISFDKVFYKKLEAYSEKMKVPMWTALQNMTIKRWAQDAAKAAVWGSNPEVLIEFSTTEAGTISPKELHEMAYQIAFDTEAKERVAMLQKEISTGIPLKNEEDKAFHEKYRHKYGSVQREQDEDSFAYWESEMTDTEALEKFKGGKGNDKK